MEAYDAESCSGEIREAAERIICFVNTKAENLEAHEVERELFSMVLAIGLAAMKQYFAVRGTGFVGNATLESGGRGLRLVKGLCSCVYFSILHSARSFGAILSISGYLTGVGIRVRVQSSLDNWTTFTMGRQA